MNDITILIGALIIAVLIVAIRLLVSRQIGR